MSINPVSYTILRRALRSDAGIAVRRIAESFAEVSLFTANASCPEA